MEAINLNLYNELMKKINLSGIKPKFCGCQFCTPECQEYEVRLFGKKYTLEFCFTNKPLDNCGRSKVDKPFISFLTHEEHSSLPSKLNISLSNKYSISYDVLLRSFILIFKVFLSSIPDSQIEKSTPLLVKSTD